MKEEGLLMKMIYQYTKLEVLALILKNKTIRFNNLCKVDDPLEKYLSTSNINQNNNHIEKSRENFGAFCLVSCWTEYSDESIAMWDMYGDRKCGVRIGLPFTSPEELFEPLDNSFFSENKIRSRFAIPIDVFYPEYIKIDYSRSLTEDPYIIGKDSKDRVVWFKDLGQYKIPDWSFQKESRFRIFCGKDKETDNDCFAVPGKTPSSIIASLDVPQNDHIDWKLKDDVFSNMEILAGPDMSAGDRILLDALVDYYKLPKIVNSKFTSE